MRHQFPVCPVCESAVHEDFVTCRLCESRAHVHCCRSHCMGVFYCCTYFTKPEPRKAEPEPRPRLDDIALARRGHAPDLGERKTA